MAESAASIPFLDLGAMHSEVRRELDAAWHRAVDSSCFVGGDPVSEFEAAFSAYCGQAEAVGVANGTDALSLILRGLEIGPGDEVIVPANTFVATAEAVCTVGAIPVFVDVDPATLLVTADHVTAALTSRTAAVMVVHLYGQPANMAALGAVCAKAGIHLIEDAAQAHGARFENRPAGSFGTAAAFSFYPSKNLGAFGDGGIVVTGDAALANAVRSLANHGRSEVAAHQHRVIGTNSRLDALQAEVLSIKLARLDHWNECRRQIHSWYDELLPAGVRQVDVAPSALPVHHLEVVQVADRDRVRVRLAEHGIHTGIHYPVPCHRLPAYERFARGRVAGQLPVVDAAASRLMSLPMYPHLRRNDVVRVCSALRAIATESSAA
jgi:dTDP-4-amino-4,6-dideoxygalactose transaminase